MKLKKAVSLIIFLVICLALLPNAQAVNPPPDGGYPGFNTAEGTNALKNLTTGSANTAVGWFSLFSNTDGNFNTATGAGALLLNTTAGENTAFGAAALLSNTTGFNNTAVGAAALLNNIDGDDNNAVGVNALHDNTVGNFNNAHGRGALGANVDGDQNNAFGHLALESVVSGNFNTAIGDHAGDTITSGSSNICVGNEAGTGITTADNVIAIGTPGQDASNTCFIGNIRNVAVNASGVPVVIDLNNQLGTIVSSRRFKNEIKPMDKASEAILALKPVTFHYKSDTTGTPQFGLIAEEVAEVNPDLVVRNKNGEIWSVRYEQINAMLLNEFLKEHWTVQEQQREIDSLKAELKEQRDLIQKVSDRVEISEPAQRAVADNQ
jgi:hypothetical protein